MNPLFTREEKPKTKDVKLSKKQVIGLILLAVAILFIMNLVMNSFTTRAARRDFQVPVWLVFIGIGAVLYFAVYFFWQAKNKIVEWLISFLFGAITGLFLLAIGYEFLFGWISIEWIKIAFGSLITTGGVTFLTIASRYLFKPLYWVLKRTYFWEAK